MVRHETFAQAIVDGLHQAINGGSSTGNATSTIKSNLQSLNTALFGSSTLGTQLQIAAIPTDDLSKDNITDLGDVYAAHVDAIGSGATMVRQSTGKVTMTTNGGAVALPANLFDYNSITSPDITPSLTDGKFTVSLDGWYHCEMCIMVNLTVATNLWKVCPVLLSNGPMGNRYGNDAQSQNSATWAPRWIKSSFEVYLLAGNYVRAGFDGVNGTGTVTNFFTGEATGSQCYFSISLSNRSLA